MEIFSLQNTCRINLNKTKKSTFAMFLLKMEIRKKISKEKQNLELKCVEVIVLYIYPILGTLPWLMSFCQIHCSLSAQSTYATLSQARFSFKGTVHSVIVSSASKLFLMSPILTIYFNLSILCQTNLNDYIY